MAEQCLHDLLASGSVFRDVAPFVLHNCLNRTAVAALLSLLERVLFHDNTDALCTPDTAKALLAAASHTPYDQTTETAVTCLGHLLASTQGQQAALLVAADVRATFRAICMHAREHPFEALSDACMDDIADIRDWLDSATKDNMSSN